MELSQSVSYKAILSSQLWLTESTLFVYFNLTITAGNITYCVPTWGQGERERERERGREREREGEGEKERQREWERREGETQIKNTS